ncbi:dephospho-CoA kinase [Bacillaceae bacterium W0354]
MTLVIGLTGSIATGKSTISNMFKEWNYPVVDADKIAREVVEPGEAAYEKIVSYFGESILNSDRTIDRKKLGHIVFNDKNERDQLNGIIHPEIRKEMLRQRDAFIEQKAPAVVLDIPLLFESQLFDYVDKVLVVYVEPEVQLERLMKRDGSSKEEALSRIKSQIPITEKKERADAFIDNSRTITDSKEQLKNILKQWNV